MANNKLGVDVENKSRAVFTSCINSIRCWAIAVAAWHCLSGNFRELQARAIFEAAAAVQRKGIKVRPEIMIPLVGFPRELKV